MNFHGLSEAIYHIHLVRSVCENTEEDNKVQTGILLRRNDTTSSSLRLPTTVIECKADDLSHKTRSSISMKRTNFHC